MRSAPLIPPNGHHSWVEATVHGRGRETRYHTAGHGRLVLALAREADEAFVRYCGIVARGARVVRPLVPAPDAVLDGSLLDLLDAFGADEATVLAHRTAALDAIALAVAHPERVTAVELLDAAAAAHAAAPAMLLPVSGRRLVPLAVARYY